MSCSGLSPMLSLIGTFRVEDNLQTYVGVRQICCGVMVASHVTKLCMSIVLYGRRS